MDALFSERQAQLTTLLDELAKRPTFDSIVRGVEVVGFDPSSDEDLKQVDAAMAGSWAHYRMPSYLEYLRHLNDERMALGQRIGQLLNHPYPTPDSCKSEVEAWAWAGALAPHLSGTQEVVINFLCICIQHIHSFLKVSAAAVDYQLPAEDDAFLYSYRVLRNHYEHWDERLPGAKYEAGLITKTMIEKEYRFQGGLRSAGEDRVFVVDPKKSPPQTYVVDVSNNGVERVETIARETNVKIKELILERVHQHFLAHPEQRIPSPDEIGNDSFIKAGWLDQ